MRINIGFGYFVRCLFSISILAFPLPFLGVILLLIRNDLIVFCGCIILYLIVLVISSFIILIIINKKFNYSYILLETNSYSLINKNGDKIDFSNSVLYIDNAFLSILISPFYLAINYEIKYDLIIQYKKNEYSRIYLTVFEFLKIKKYGFKYTRFQ